MTRMVCVGTGAGSSAEAVALVRSMRQPDSAAVAEGVELWATVGLHPHDAIDGVDSLDDLLRGGASASGRPAGRRRPGGRGHRGVRPRLPLRPLAPPGAAGGLRPPDRAGPPPRPDPGRPHPGGLGRHPRHPGRRRRAGADHHPLLHRGPEEARRCLDLGASLSFSGVVTFKNADDVREAAALCPMDRLLVETDSPFLTPVPHRGTLNEPSRVPLVGAAIAQVKGVETGLTWPRSPPATPGPPSALSPASGAGARALPEPHGGGRTPVRASPAPPSRFDSLAAACLTFGLRPPIQRSFCFSMLSAAVGRIARVGLEESARSIPGRGWICTRGARSRRCSTRQSHKESGVLRTRIEKGRPARCRAPPVWSIADRPAAVDPRTIREPRPHLAVARALAPGVLAVVDHRGRSGPRGSWPVPDQVVRRPPSGRRSAAAGLRLPLSPPRPVDSDHGAYHDHRLRRPRCRLPRRSARSVPVAVPTTTTAPPTTTTVPPSESDPPKRSITARSPTTTTRPARVPARGCRSARWSG